MHKDGDSETLHGGHGSRRHCLRSVAGAALTGLASFTTITTGLMATPAHAQAARQAARRYAVVSLIGDRLVVVYAGRVTGTNMDANRRRVIVDEQGAMDRFALVDVGQALDLTNSTNSTDRTDRTAAALLAFAPSPLHEQADRLFDGKNVALPGSLVDAVEQSRATHLVLLTKHRADASIPMVDSRLGVGKLNGLGYYIDANANIRMIESGATGRGLLAPYVYVKLSLADARSGALLNQRHCTAARAYAVAESETALDPWEVLTASDKVSRLRGLLQSELAREVPLLVAA